MSTNQKKKKVKTNNPEEPVNPDEPLTYQEQPPMAVQPPEESDPYAMKPMFDLKDMIGQLTGGDGDGKGSSMPEVLMVMTMMDHIEAKQDRADKRKEREELRKNPPPPVDIAKVVADAVTTAVDKATDKFEKTVLTRDLKDEQVRADKAETHLEETSERLIASEKELSETKSFLAGLEDKMADVKEKLGALSDTDKKGLEKTLAAELTTQTEKMVKSFIKDLFKDKGTGPAVTPEGKPDYIKIVHKVIDLANDFVKKMPEEGYVPDQKDIDEMDESDEAETKLEDEILPPAQVDFEVPPIPTPAEKVIDVEEPVPEITPAASIPAPDETIKEKTNIVEQEGLPEKIHEPPTDIEKPEEIEESGEEEKEDEEEEESFACDVCGKSFDNKRSLRGHKASKHGRGTTTT